MAEEGAQTNRPSFRQSGKKLTTKTPVTSIGSHFLQHLRTGTMGSRWSPQSKFLSNRKMKKLQLDEHLLPIDDTPTFLSNRKMKKLQLDEHLLPIDDTPTACLAAPLTRRSEDHAVPILEGG
ncbi:hypothetical protein T265_01745 [Opisthorchis viverrini]|uniref:Uncharacterized protein n=1 Tax=Opisthorchis viverrini TaxID=6198 RepID=A0A074ZXE8_OPIVI|nr:hypothetical protein T265_01745 [Opisthorchis viverrini]KER32123.1 hypothetical protein T265_01745 [Opisthorchis viverrini]